MSKLLNRSLKSFIVYAALVLAGSIPVYYVAINMLWKYEQLEHQIILTPEAGREDRLLIVGAVTLLTVLFFALLLTGFILLNRRISQRLWQPFYNSLAKIRNFSLEQNKPVVFEKTEIDEFAQLNQSLDKLITGNIAAYTQQKEFAENASHELQTPLAIVQLKLELLMQSHSLTTEQYNIIEDALKALSRVNRVNRNLLLLTKIENSQYMEKDTIDASELLNTLIPQFETIATGEQIKLLPVLKKAVTISGNRTLVEILLNNLITNAIRYSAAGSDITLVLSANSFIITNPGDRSLQTEQLFKRFAS
ncbi:MAG TPA: HAMP domain-containing sensor histidine kinase, partial [Niastella sp.]|nr:HAMP domain-containing sensor histidine kinase [Niastella sp.]